MPNAFRDNLRAIGNALAQTRPNNGAWANREIGNWLTGPIPKDDRYGEPIPGDASSLASLLNQMIPHPGQSEEDIIAGTLGFMLPTGGVGAARNLMRGPMPESVVNAIGWHGSPHKFPPTPKNALGEFDANKIGTGEGAQAYGHGLYFAENPQVAKDYAEQPIRWNGLWISQAGKGNLYKAEIPDEHINKMLDWDKPLSEQGESVRSALEQSGIADSARQMQGKADPSGSDLHYAAVRRTASDALQARQGVGQQEASRILREAGIPGIRYLDQGSRGGPDVLHDIVSSKGKFKGGAVTATPYSEPLEEVQNALELFRRDYPDARIQSRAPKRTSNYVVFDPSITNILGRE